MIVERETEHDANLMRVFVVHENNYLDKLLVFVVFLKDKLGNADEERLSIVSDLESILTFYCKSRTINYDADNGWASILQLLLALKYTKAELYNSFYAIVTKYIPK